MKIAHVALWTRDMDASVTFWSRYFHAVIGDEYQSLRRPGFVSRFISIPGSDVKIELMTAPWLKQAGEGDFIGWDHIAISLGSAEAVEDMALRCNAAGIFTSPPRTTGDGFYEAVISCPDGSTIEITS